MSVRWGTVPEWVEAIATALAFAVTLTLLIHEILWRREEQTERRAEAAERHDARREREIAQARLVWAEGKGMSSGPSQAIAGHLRITTDAVLHNDSDETIRQVHMAVFDPTGAHLGDTGPASGPTAIVGPRERLVCRLTVELSGERDFGKRGTCSVELTFTDARGLRWMRDRAGDLARAPATSD